jgi:tRNA-splicing ligase RtcB
VHSGSRGLGGAIAAHHQKAAHAAAGAGGDPLAGLDARTEEGAAYFADVTWALAFARANRAALIDRALDVVCDFFRGTITRDDVVDIHHNFVAKESWLGEELFIHRKGAVAIPDGSLAIVPGSMGTASYIVRGKGCHESFGSCSHGAGRVLSRGEARKRIRPHALARAMKDVVYPEHLARSLVEEAPSAYRDIAEVLDDQEDLVERETRLEPIAVLKG